MRIQRLAAANGASNDELQKVRFEVNHNAEMYGRVLEASLAAFTQCERSEVRPSAALALAGNTQISRLFALGLSRTPRLLPAGEQQYDMSGTVTLAGGSKKSRRADKGRTPIADGQTILTIASKGPKNRT
jgi:hypothetical protein